MLPPGRRARACTRGAECLIHSPPADTYFFIAPCAHTRARNHQGQQDKVRVLPQEKCQKIHPGS